jgi:hypothetical protein
MEADTGTQIHGYITASFFGAALAAREAGALSLSLSPSPARFVEFKMLPVQNVSPILEEERTTHCRGQGGNKRTHKAVYLNGGAEETTSPTLSSLLLSLPRVPSLHLLLLQPRRRRLRLVVCVYACILQCYTEWV